jgi:hypothetical protein
MAANDMTTSKNVDGQRLAAPNGSAIVTLRLVIADVIDRETAASHYGDDALKIVNDTFESNPFEMAANAESITIIGAEMNWPNARVSDSGEKI